MRQPSSIARVGMLGVAAMLASLLAGCEATEPSPTPSASETDAPVFATEDEALAAAEAAYAEYLEVSDEVAQDGGADVERVRDFVTPEYYESQQSDYAELNSNDLRIDGSSRLRSATLQSQSTSGQATTVSVYFCVDISDTELLDSDGEPQGPDDRDEVYPLLVELRSPPDAGNSLLVHSSVAWTGQNYCSD